MQTKLACDLANRLLVVTVLLGTVEDLKGAYKMNRVRYSLDIEIRIGTEEHTLHNVQVCLLLAISILIRAHASITLHVDKSSIIQSAICPNTHHSSSFPNIPLRQTQDVIPLPTLRQESTNAEPARLAVIAGSIRSSNRVANDLLAGGCSSQFGLSAQAAGDDHAGDGARRGVAEAARGDVGGAGETQSRAEGGEGRHCGVAWSLRGCNGVGWTGIQGTGPVVDVDAGRVWSCDWPLLEIGWIRFWGLKGVLMGFCEYDFNVGRL